MLLYYRVMYESIAIARPRREERGRLARLMERIARSL